MYYFIIYVLLVDANLEEAFGMWRSRARVNSDLIFNRHIFLQNKVSQKHSVG